VWHNCWVVPMGIRLRSCNIYGLGYCSTMSWSAIIIVNSVCDICASFASRLRFDLYTFWEIFGWVWVWSLCVQQFWACKFMVSLCLLWSVLWRVTGDRVGVTVWRSVNSPVWRFGRVRRRRSWCAWMFVGDRNIVVWGVGLADDRTAACLCVSPCRRLLRSAISYNKKMCRVCIWLCSPSVVCWLYCVSWSFLSSR